MSTFANHSRRYRHYGLTIESTVTLPGLPAANDGPTDVHVEVLRAPERPHVDSTWTAVNGLPGAWRAPGPAGSHLRLQLEGPSGNWAEFLLDDTGTTVRVTLGESSALDDACELLLAKIFSHVLAQRGLTCLHASVVAVDDRVIALVGAKGAGKSTLALALAQRGGQLLSDDVAPISSRGGVCGVAVGRAAVRIWPDSAASLGRASTELRPVWSSVSGLAKGYYEQDEHRKLSNPAWRPLAAVFLLPPRGRVATPSARPVPRRDLLPALLANRHAAEGLDHRGHRRDLDCLAMLVRHVPGRELLRPDDLRAVSAAAEAVAVAVRGVSGP
jgi:hypothetical protein